MSHSSFLHVSSSNRNYCNDIRKRLNVAFLDYDKLDGHSVAIIVIDGFGLYSYIFGTDSDDLIEGNNCQCTFVAVD